MGGNNLTNFIILSTSAAFLFQAAVVNSSALNWDDIVVYVAVYFFFVSCARVMSKAITVKATNIFRNIHKFSISVLRYLESNADVKASSSLEDHPDLEAYIAKLAEIVREGLEDQNASDKLLQIRINMVLDDIGGKRRSTRIEAILAEQVKNGIFVSPDSVPECTASFRSF
jgi:hypothetical protein